jgi:hypothetical protein
MEKILWNATCQKIQNSSSKFSKLLLIIILLLICSVKIILKEKTPNGIYAFHHSIDEKHVI